MKILCTVKRVPDPEVKIKFLPGGAGVVTEGVNHILNPFDEYGVEEALRIKEKKNAEVVVVSVGTSQAQQEIRKALAMGADRAILVLVDTPTDPDLVARLLAKIVEQEKPDFVFTGKQAVDDDANQVGQLLAAYLDWPQATFASKLDLDADDKGATIARETDGGTTTEWVAFPAVITADLRLNTPRYASLPGIMKAKKKELKEVPAASLGVDLSPKLKTYQYDPPSQRQAGVKVADVATLLLKLQNEAKAL